MLYDIENDELQMNNIAEIKTNKVVTISEFLSPINLPKKPEIIEAISGSYN